MDRFTVVTGVSGSGKSTLVKECLKPAMDAALRGKPSPDQCGQLHGYETFKAVYEVDQSPIGRTPRSTPATYVGFFDEIRKIFSQLPEARARGYTVGKFSFNSSAGRCPECQGAGSIKIEMNFLPTAYVECGACQGGRYSEEVLDIEYQGLNISQVLNLSVAEAIEYFQAFQKIRRPLEALASTGLDYLKLGQTSPTLSGGEAQRLKLVSHLLGGISPSGGRAALQMSTGPQRRLFILEEPTIGLHAEDVRKLVAVIQQLVDNGNTVIVIEHHLDLIAEADWVIDLGPEGGDAGGRIIAQGTPEKIARSRKSHTGDYLRKLPGLKV
jgi:excinuclease ABC subunit A